MQFFVGFSSLLPEILYHSQITSHSVYKFKTLCTKIQQLHKIYAILKFTQVIYMCSGWWNVTMQSVQLRNVSRSIVRDSAEQLIRWSYKLSLRASSMMCKITVFVGLAWKRWKYLDVSSVLSMMIQKKTVIIDHCIVQLLQLNVFYKFQSLKVAFSKQVRSNLDLEWVITSYCNIPVNLTDSSMQMHLSRFVIWSSVIEWFCWIALSYKNSPVTSALVPWNQSSQDAILKFTICGMLKCFFCLV